MLGFFYQVTFTHILNINEKTFRVWLKDNHNMFRGVNIVESLDLKDLLIGHTFYFYTETKPHIILYLKNFLRSLNLGFGKPVDPPVGKLLKVIYSTVDFNDWVKQEGTLVF